MGQLNVKPRTVFCRDNLDILAGINSDCIDLIYLDPPFNKNKIFTAPMDSVAEGAEFSDIFQEKDIKDEWVAAIRYENYELYSYLTGVKGLGNQYNYCYLVYMAVRLLECRRVLKGTGSIYLHCDPTMSHYLKIVMDCIFGENNFRNEIVWYYKNASRGRRNFAQAHDIIFYYSKGGDCVFNRDSILASFESGMTEWRYSKGGQKGKEKPAGKTPDNVIVMPSLNAMSKERTGYPTQKPLALIEYIIKASSHEGDVVLDPFCGCATTCIAAERLKRSWIGIDVSYKAYELVRNRIKKEVVAPLLDGEPAFSTNPPRRDEDIRDDEYGYVYVISNANWKGIYKVGIAKDPQRRLNSYQTSDPYRAYRLEYQLHTPYYREIERHVHNRFNATNEWLEGKLPAIRRTIEKYDSERRG